MGKVEDMRAMKQQRRAAAAAAAPVTPAAPHPTVPRAARPAGSSPDAAVPAVVDGGTQDLCGHRSIGNRSCTRPAGHAEKNHRYAPTERPTG